MIYHSSFFLQLCSGAAQSHPLFKEVIVYFLQGRRKSCQNVIGNQSIFDKFGDKLRHSKTLARSFERYIPFYPFSEGCKSIIADLYCRYLFPLCDTTLSTPYPRHICRKSCEFALHVICKDDLTRFKEIAQRDPDFDPNLINCSTYPVDGGGEAPECHQYHSLPGTSQSPRGNSQKSVWRKGLVV